ncbi:AAA family ATPase [Aphanothece sacrum]|uniref:Restriction endonuclease n=1 Tax=Aphanothece sacrum FPU1 TaxID=1920663 RepID=A0A401IET5_APHSA|nr:AAA family ATPase [Aphanothece sacrum]GBF79719.1 hypothetical protein AsFPU1_1118 [Aphanothece sacrum FPU1]GBF86300.1 hypothetical protein AsFPU3_3371 [Aphanothece sacrum FPU3]
MPSSIKEAEFIADFVHFEQHVAKLFTHNNWQVETAKTNQPGYDLTIKKNQSLGVVQVKWLKSNVTAPQLLKFVDFLASPEAKPFNCAYFITTKGFSGPACAVIRSWGENVRIYCGVAQENGIEWIPSGVGGGGGGSSVTPPTDKIYFGVFTCKGGVGKTTVAAHLAGALALQGFDIALLDLDPEQNLHKLLWDGVYVPNPGGVGNTIEVFNKDTWDENSVQNCQIVICDCSPALERNDRELIKRLNYCIIPTTLNPLGMNKHGKVIQSTVQEIRSINQTANLFILVNNFRDPGVKRFKILKQNFLDVYQDISQTDKKFDCIDPEEVCIRFSDLLYYWGIHLLEDPQNPRSELAFKLVGGIPRWNLGNN